MTTSLEALLSGVLQQEPLARHTTFRIGGPARYFFIARTPSSVIRALRAAKSSKTPFFVLAGGSNVVMSDKGFRGLVIYIKILDHAMRGTRVSAGAGVPMALLVREAGKRGLAGLEWAGGLPGTLGGAVRGNAGAFGGEIKDSVVSVKAIDEKGKVRTFSRAQCKFSYR
ncbi:MAG: FAD-binding protein, partial [bacterium]|nr:FAD-binding protein [bacterium]